MQRKTRRDCRACQGGLKFATNLKSPCRIPTKGAQLGVYGLRPFEADKEVMTELDVAINDMYALCMEDERCYKCEDLLHLSEEGSRRCAAQVAQYVREYA